VRIAFLANPVHDYLQDVVYHGLVGLLGSDRVVDFPPLERYHAPPPADAAYPHLWFDFPQPERERTLRAEIREADAIVIGSLRSGVRTFVDEVLALRSRPPIAFLDGEDDIFVLGVHRHVERYFKREIVLPGAASRPGEVLRRAHRLLRRGRENRDTLADPVRVARSGDRRLIPLPFAWAGPLPERRPIEHDVAFLARPTSYVRVVIRNALERLAAEGVRVRLLAEGESLSWREYIDILRRSRIGVSVRGGGFDTYRYWEVPAAGALLLSERPQIVIPDNFVDGVEAVFDRPRHLASRIPDLLAGGTEGIAARGLARLQASHLSIHRARTVLDALATLTDRR
jgi:hypothetical protein